MQILILGAGQVGSSIAESLCTEHDVTVIDVDPKKLDALQNRLDIQTIEGSGAYPHILSAAGAEHAEMLIAVTGSDECNMIACQLCALLFKTQIKIARIRCPELYQHQELFTPERIAIDLIIDPSALVTEQLKRQVEHPGCLLVWDFTPDDSLQIASIRIEPGSWLHHCSAQSLSTQFQDEEDAAMLVGVVRDHQIIFAEALEHFAIYDELIFCAKRAAISKITKKLLQEQSLTPYKRIMIAGAGHIGTAFAENLEQNYLVKIIEPSSSRSANVAERLQHTLVLKGDATDTDLLKQEGIESIDLFCAVTNEDDVNIMSSILAKRMGAKHTIALVNRQTYAHYLIERSPDIDTAISPQYITGSQILKALYQNNFLNIYRFFHGTGYAIEIKLQTEKPHLKKLIGKRINKLKLPKSCKVVAIYRAGQALPLEENTTTQTDDHVLIVLNDNKTLNFFSQLSDP